MTQRSLQILAIALFLGMASMPAKANEDNIVHCGDPVEASINTESEYAYCDIFSRQISFAEKGKVFTGQLKTRQRNYNAPRDEAYRIYKEEVQAMYDRDNAIAAAKDNSQ